MDLIKHNPLVSNGCTNIIMIPFNWYDINDAEDYLFEKKNSDLSSTKNIIRDARRWWLTVVGRNNSPYLSSSVIIITSSYTSKWI